MALLAAYNFDEVSGEILDASGNGRHFALNNNLIRTASGHTNRGITKDGVGLPVIASPAFGQTTARTVMFWQQGLGDAVWWLRWWTSSGDTGTWGLYNLGGTLNLRLRKGGSNTNTTTTAPSDGLWHHYAGTYDGTNARLYLDGTLVGTSGTVTGPLDNAERIDFLEGTIPNFAFDDLRIYDEALDQPTIAALMNTPVGSGPTEITGTGQGSAGGSGSAAGDVEVAATAAGLGGGSGAVTGTRERVGQANGSGVGSGTAVGTREREGSATGTGGGVGLVVVVAPVSRGGSHPLARSAPSGVLLTRTTSTARGL